MYQKTEIKKPERVSKVACDCRGLGCQFFSLWCRHVLDHFNRCNLVLWLINSFLLPIKKKQKNKPFPYTAHSHSHFQNQKEKPPFPNQSQITREEINQSQNSKMQLTAKSISSINPSSIIPFPFRFPFPFPLPFFLLKKNRMKKTYHYAKSNSFIDRRVQRKRPQSQILTQLCYFSNVYFFIEENLFIERVNRRAISAVQMCFERSRLKLIFYQ